MKPASVSQMAINKAILDGLGIVDIPLKQKYTIHVKAKFGGKKHKNSNSGGMGRAGRRKARPKVPTRR